jgi:glycosyltransferase involved in cell wall biosynthesis
MYLPLISIITPCYNAEPFLKDAIESVLSQTYSNFEWIIINDGSKDNTECVIQSYDDYRIRYYKQENKGQCSASNFGLRIATGDYIKFFDADDVMNSEHLEAQLKKIGSRKDALASCAWGRFYDNNPYSAKFISETVWEDLNTIDWIRKSLSQQNDMMGAWIWLIPREIIEKTGGWDESLSLNNDFEFSIRILLSATDVLFTSEAKIYYRSGNLTLSQQVTENEYKAAILSNDIGCRKILNHDSSQQMRKLCANRYQEWLFRIYPLMPDIQEQLENRINELGGSSNKMGGGKVFKLLSFIMGWKLTKKIQFFLKQQGYVKLPFN